MEGCVLYIVQIGVVNGVISGSFAGDDDVAQRGGAGREPDRSFAVGYYPAVQTAGSWQDEVLIPVSFCVSVGTDLSYEEPCGYGGGGYAEDDTHKHPYSHSGFCVMRQINSIADL